MTPESEVEILKESLTNNNDWVPHDSTKPPPALGPDFEVQAMVRTGIDRTGYTHEKITTAPVHEIPWDRVTAWRLP